MKLNDIVTWTGRNGKKSDSGLLLRQTATSTVLCDGVSGPNVRDTTGFAVNDYL